jgi:hypothetical protein
MPPQNYECPSCRHDMTNSAWASFLRRQMASKMSGMRARIRTSHHSNHSAMAKPTAESIAAALTVPERLLLFCLASNTDWQSGITHATAQHLMIRGLIERDQAATRYALTEERRAVLAALLKGRNPDAHFTT